MGWKPRTRRQSAAAKHQQEVRDRDNRIHELERDVRTLEALVAARTDRADRFERELTLLQKPPVDAMRALVEGMLLVPAVEMDILQPMIEIGTYVRDVDRAHRESVAGGNKVEL